MSELQDAIEQNQADIRAQQVKYLAGSVIAMQQRLELAKANLVDFENRVAAAIKAAHEAVEAKDTIYFHGLGSAMYQINLDNKIPPLIVDGTITSAKIVATSIAATATR